MTDSWLNPTIGSSEAIIAPRCTAYADQRDIVVLIVLEILAWDCHVACGAQRRLMSPDAVCMTSASE